MWVVETGSWVLTHLSFPLLPRYPFLGVCRQMGLQILLSDLREADGPQNQHLHFRAVTSGKPPHLSEPVFSSIN